MTLSIRIVGAPAERPLPLSPGLREYVEAIAPHGGLKPYSQVDRMRDQFTAMQRDIARAFAIPARMLPDLVEGAARRRAIRESMEAADIALIVAALRALRDRAARTSTPSAEDLRGTVPHYAGRPLTDIDAARAAYEQAFGRPFRRQFLQASVVAHLPAFRRSVAEAIAAEVAKLGKAPK